MPLRTCRRDWSTRWRPAVAVPAAMLLTTCVIAACGSTSPSGSGTTTSSGGSSTTATTTTAGGSGATGSGSTGSGNTGAGNTGQASGGSLTATITQPGGPILQVSGTTSCEMSSSLTIVLTATGHSASGEAVRLSAGVDGGYKGPGSYDLTTVGSATVTIGTNHGGLFSDGHIVFASGARSATVSGHYADQTDATAGMQDVTGSVQATLSWASCPNPNP